MKTLNLKHLNGEYNIKIEKGIFKKIQSILDKFRYGKCIIITDKNIYKLYDKEIIKLKTEVIVIEPGEKSKSISVYEKTIEKIIKSNFSRDDIILSIGGGVVGDLAGFIAATILRGVRFIQIPTTLLSQVDSSIGGKVAVNSKYGKNLIGSFYQPELVIIDPEFLKTLPDKEIRSGLGELIKHACIRDKNLFNLILKAYCFDDLYENIEEILEKSLKIKKEVVELDEFDKGIRMILNFGHTIGHAFEKSIEVRKMTHGEAVALGILEITKLSEDQGLTKKGTYRKLTEIFDSFHMTEIVHFSKDEIFKYIKRDKKIFGNTIKIIVLEEIGKAVIKEFKIKQFEEFLGGANESEYISEQIKR